MSGALARLTLRRSLASIKYLTPVPPKAARGLVAQVYGQVVRDFGMYAPPTILHAPAPAALAASWLLLRETLIAHGPAGRVSKEVVAAAVSQRNACPYCVDVHGATLYGLARASTGDPSAAGLVAWTGGGEPDFPADQAPELVGTAVTFHYLNRMVNVFLGESPLPAGPPPAVHGRLLKMLGLMMRPAAARVAEPGLSLDLLPPAPIPADLSWAAGSPVIADACARAYAAIGAAPSVSGGVRALVSARLAAWDGLPPGPSGAWADADVARMPADDRPAARLALLTALGSYQVGPSAVAGFGDRELVEITSWASLAAAREMGARLSVK
ncbi:carboxymuconolactone decarboxylase family protein [Streptosporangiaceae bacterium NEAU-GS5]|nr:carboxymuconolactone decarboxylase family protein [Streptosporangiaceae bacterium NEAU-GS5]